MAVNKTLQQVIRSHIDKFQEELLTAIPAEIDNVDNLKSKQAIDCHITINFLYKDDDVVENKVIQDVPVVFPSGGGGMLSFPLKVGDPVLLVFSSRNIEDWKGSSGGNVTPSFRRFHDMSDAVAIPCLYPEQLNLSPNPNDTELKFADTFITLRENGDLDIVTGQNQNITVNGNNTVNIVGREDTTVTEDKSLEVGGNNTVNITGDNITNITGTSDLTVTGDATATFSGALTGSVGTNADLTVGGNLTSTVTGSAAVTAADATVTATTITLNGNVTINGTLGVTGSVTTGTGMQVGGVVVASDLIAGGITYTTHIHTGDSGGDTGPPK